jgi:hypothetical protein
MDLAKGGGGRERKSKYGEPAPVCYCSDICSRIPIGSFTTLFDFYAVEVPLMEDRRHRFSKRVLRLLNSDRLLACEGSWRDLIHRSGLLRKDSERPLPPNEAF